MADIAGLALTGPAIVTHLINLYVDAYRKLRETQSVGQHVVLFEQKLSVIHRRLEDWISSVKEIGGNLEEVVSNAHFRTIQETLVLIAKTFLDIQKLQERNGLINYATDEIQHLNHSHTEHVQDSAISLCSALSGSDASNNSFSLKAQLKKSLKGLRHVASLSRGTTFMRRTKIGHSSGENLLSQEADRSRISQNSVPFGALTILETQQTELWQAVPGLGGVWEQIRQRAVRHQQQFTLVKRCRWVFFDQEEFRSLVDKLDSYTRMLCELTENALNGRSSSRNNPLKPQFLEFEVPIWYSSPWNPKFAGRELELEQVNNKLNPEITSPMTGGSSRILVLAGMKGVGKSQLALEYLYRNAERRYTSAFWIDGSDQETIELSGLRIMGLLIAHYATRFTTSRDRLADYEAIGQHLGIPGRIPHSGQLNEDARIWVWQVMRAWLARPTNTRWCLVVDGMDDGSLDNAKIIRPACNHGHIIFTTTDRALAPHTGGQLLNVPVLTDDDSLELLLKGTDKALIELTKEEHEAATSIIHQLGHLPLALSLASAYIVTYSQTFLQYLSFIRDDPSLLFKMPGLSSWIISIRRLEEKNSDAIHLLKLCAMYSSEGVHEEFLFAGIKALWWCQNDKLRLRTAIDDLVQLSMLQRQSTDHTKSPLLSMHSLLREWAPNIAVSFLSEHPVHYEQSPEKQYYLSKEAAQKSIRVLGAASSLYDSDDDRKDYLETLNNYIRPQLRVCQHHFYKYFDENNPEFCKLPVEFLLAPDEMFAVGLRYLARRLQQVFDPIVRDTLFLHAIKEFERLPNPTVNQLAEVWRTKTEAMTKPKLPPWEDIDNTIDEIIACQTKHLGPLHSDTLMSMDLKAQRLYGLKRYEEALELAQHVMAAFENKFNGQVPHWNISNTIPRILNKLGKKEEELYEIERRYKSCLHANTDEVTKALGRGWCSMCVWQCGVARHRNYKFKEALPLLHQARMLREERNEHYEKDTLSIYLWEMDCMLRLGELDAALEMANDYLIRCNKTYGEYRGEVVTAMTYLVVLNGNLKRNEEAARWAHLAAEIAENSLDSKKGENGFLDADAKETMESMKEWTTFFQTTPGFGNLKLGPIAIGEKPIAATGHLAVFAGTNESEKL